MKVHELIKLFQEHDPEMDVFVPDYYHDLTGQAATPVVERITVHEMKRSAEVDTTPYIEPTAAPGATTMSTRPAVLVSWGWL